MHLATRLRRLRRTEALRRMARETRLSPDNLIMPLFVHHEPHARRPIASMPGQFQLGVAEAAETAAMAADLGIPGVILFGIPQEKDAVGSGAWSDDGPVCRAVRTIKELRPGLCVITDVCLCEYTDHGHCGVVGSRRGAPPDVDNDATVELLAKAAIAHARAGADMVAPSDMMDGRVGAIRTALDAERHEEVGLLAYSAKYASAFYGPFRDAAESSPRFGDRASYQMDPPNADEAMREIALDIEEGADVIMVKPALAYLDVVRRAAETFCVPIAAYNVSGEYAMVKAAAARGWLDERRAAMEMLAAIRRAGATMILTYWAMDAARWIRDKE